jgi:hypothetical protein
MAVVWRDRRDVQMLTNIHNPPEEDNFCDEKWKHIKPNNVEDYCHTGYVDKGERVVSQPPPTEMGELSFHPLDLTILRCYAVLSLCGGNKISHTEFWVALVKNKMAYAEQQPRIHRPSGRPAYVVSKVSWILVATSNGLSHILTMVSCRFTLQGNKKSQCKVLEI